MDFFNFNLIILFLLLRKPILWIRAVHSHLYQMTWLVRSFDARCLCFFKDWRGWEKSLEPKTRKTPPHTQANCEDNIFYYMEESELLGTKPLVDSIRHFIWAPIGVFSVCHLCECRIVQWRHDSHILLWLNWFFASRLFSLHIIKRTFHGGSKIWILCSRGKNNISLVRCAHSWDIVLATRT